jgi:hypothetical protein
MFDDHVTFIDGFLLGIIAITSFAFILGLLWAAREDDND